MNVEKIAELLASSHVEEPNERDYYFGVATQIMSRRDEWLEALGGKRWQVGIMDPDTGQRHWDTWSFPAEEEG